MFAVLAGGTGSVKLVRGLAECGLRLSVIANVGDNFHHHGLYICPDVDTVVYGLSGGLDEQRGWGVKGDTFNFLSQTSRLGFEDWFKLGDRDLALHVLRTSLMKEGLRLSAITTLISERMGIEHKIVPATDDVLETHLETSEGRLHLQEFWVKRKGEPRIDSVRYLGSESAEPAPGALEGLRDAEAVVITPGNPASSIGTILAVRRIREALRNSRSPVVAISPIIGGSPVSGPAAKMMEALGAEVSCFGVARLYSDFLDRILIDRADTSQSERIRSLGIEVTTTNIMMRDRADELRLAREVISAARSI